ncbi:conjugal transfer protein TraX [Jeotgalibaca sp. MA1X17-3]|uniref:TraX family protein n=1 Tax=Jeotgalibaca sp. MA1X17-3 TaxID=2908211 RepID=UPI001F15E34C|nr:TraX family protein [Jeotgalibaca sp. MA1X17-3]UJF15840.1 conjugal transfer protein TraX [Jeotgalibaca sp. MA1X17-3]
MEYFKKGISGHQLKMFAIVLMVFDHIQQMFSYAGAPLIFTMLGRSVLTIFLFTSVEGYYYTRDKKKYAIRLLLFYWMMNVLNGIISQLFPLEPVTLLNNVFGTLLVAVIVMFLIDCFKNKKGLKGLLLLAIPLIPTVLTNLLLQIKPDSVYNFYLLFPSYTVNEGGKLMIVLAGVLYIFREKRVLQCLAIFLGAIASTGLDSDGLLTTNIQWMMIFSIVPILLYNGQKGKSSKYFFYTFYPTHVYALYILSYFYAMYYF